MSKHFAIMDYGSGEITAVVARWGKSGDYLLEGFYRGASRGLRSGIVDDVAAATDSIHNALNGLKERSGKSFSDVYSGITSSSIGVLSSLGVVALSKYGREIGENDIKKCVRMGSTVKIPLDKEVLHYIVNGFSVDEEGGVKDPLNLEGVKLSASVNIVTISSSAVNNLAKCIISAGFTPAGFVFSGLAMSYRGLTVEDKERGVILLDMSPKTTEALVFNKGVLTGCKVFPAGVDSFLEQDERVNGAALDDLVLRVKSLPGWDKARKTVITGRGAMVDGLIEALEKSFGLSTEAGAFLVKPFEELPPERMRYLGNIGILDYLHEKKTKERRSVNLPRRIFSRVLSFVDRYF